MSATGRPYASLSERANPERLVLRDPEPEREPEFDGRRKDLPIVPHARSAALAALSELGPVVYALLLDERIIKIGHTANLAQRIRTLGEGHSSRDIEILAITFGTHDDEMTVHRKLKTSRARGREWYHPTPEVLDQVNAWRAALGRGALHVHDGVVRSFANG